jgi:four helix bundle protein
VRRNHRGLKAWQQAMALVEQVYRHTARYPESERFGLVSQMRRATVSVPSNVAEGFARSGSRELLHFLSIASGSLSELDTLVELASRLGYERQPDDLRQAIDDVAGLVMGLSASIERRV